jgi:maleate isomerase
MTYSSWRGTVGVIKPTRSSQSFQDLVRIMPDGVGLIPLYLDFRYKSADEFGAAMPAYAEKVTELAEQGVDLIHPEGAPPFMLQGLDGERRRVRAWERTYGIPVFTTGMTQLAALKALRIRRFMGITTLGGGLARTFARYFTEAGYEVLSMGRPITASDELADVSPEQLYAMTKKTFLAQRGRPEAIYVLGSGWRTLDVIEELEQDLGVPVLHPVVVRCWYIQKRLHVRQPIRGMGRLLAEMP